jgi:hypothetical protein
MKKTTLFGLTVVVLVCAVTSSCKKEYSCVCTGTYLGVSADTAIALGKMSRRDAKSECNNFSNTYGGIAALFGATISCEID